MLASTFRITLSACLLLSACDNGAIEDRSRETTRPAGTGKGQEDAGDSDDTDSDTDENGGDEDSGQDTGSGSDTGDADTTDSGSGEGSGSGTTDGGSGSGPGSDIGSNPDEDDSTQNPAPATILTLFPTDNTDNIPVVTKSQREVARTRRYNAAGELTEDIKYVHTKNADNQIVSSVLTSNDAPYISFSYEFNGDKRLTTYTMRSSTNAVITTSDYTWDSNGRMVTIDSESGLHWVTTLAYDDNGRQISSVANYNPIGMPVNRTITRLTDWAKKSLETSDTWTTSPSHTYSEYYYLFEGRSRSGEVIQYPLALTKHRNVLTDSVTVEFNCSIEGDTLKCSGNRILTDGKTSEETFTGMPLKIQNGMAVSYMLLYISRTETTRDSAGAMLSTLTTSTTYKAASEQIITDTVIKYADNSEKTAKTIYDAKTMDTLEEKSPTGLRTTFEYIDL